MKNVVKVIVILCVAVASGVLLATQANVGPALAQTGLAQTGLSACNLDLETIDANRLPAIVDLDDCPVNGRDIVDGEVSTVLPPPGEGIYAETLTTDGPHELLVTRTPDGTIELSNVGGDFGGDSEEEGAGSSLAGDRTLSAAKGCDQAAFDDNPFAVGAGASYKVNRNTTPNELTRRGALGAIRRGTANITNTRNPCRLGDRVPVGFVYSGKTARLADAGGNRCSRSDDLSVVSFGKLPKGVLAVTCTTFNSGKVKASDMNINKANAEWTTRPTKSCRGRYDLESVVTHERGHTFGLGHVSEGSGGALTMNPVIEGYCETSWRTLGRGDVLGLDGKYP